MLAGGAGLEPVFFDCHPAVLRVVTACGTLAFLTRAAQSPKDSASDPLKTKSSPSCPVCCHSSVYLGGDSRLALCHRVSGSSEAGCQLQNVVIASCLPPKDKGSPPTLWCPQRLALSLPAGIREIRSHLGTASLSPPSNIRLLAISFPVTWMRGLTGQKRSPLAAFEEQKRKTVTRPSER